MIISKISLFDVCKIIYKTKLVMFFQEVIHWNKLVGVIMRVKWNLSKLNCLVVILLLICQSFSLGIISSKAIIPNRESEFFPNDIIYGCYDLVIVDDLLIAEPGSNTYYYDITNPKEPEKITIELLIQARVFRDIWVLEYYL